MSNTNTTTELEPQAQRVAAKEPEPNELARMIAAIADDRKAEDILVLDIRSLSIIADYFVICSGTSDRQVRAIAKEIDEQLSKQDIKATHIEGLNDAQWVLMDYSNVLVHVFDPTTRDFYKLEKLWAEAPRVLVIQ